MLPSYSSADTAHLQQSVLISNLLSQEPTVASVLAAIASPYEAKTTTSTGTIASTTPPTAAISTVTSKSTDIIIFKGEPANTTNDPKHNAAAIVAFIVTPILVIFALLALIVLCIRRRRRRAAAVTYAEKEPEDEVMDKAQLHSDCVEVQKFYEMEGTSYMDSKHEMLAPVGSEMSAETVGSEERETVARQETPEIRNGNRIERTEVMVEEDDDDAVDGIAAMSPVSPMSPLTPRV